VSEYVKAIATLIAATAAALAAAIGNGSLDDLDNAGWIKVALVVLGEIDCFTRRLERPFGGASRSGRISGNPTPPVPGDRLLSAFTSI